MIPRSVIEGISCGTCLRIYCYLDLKSGKQGFGTRSARYIGRQLRMKPETVTKHLKDLEQAGYITIRRKGGTKAWQIQLDHNPARGRSVSSVLPIETSRGEARPRRNPAPPERQDKRMTARSDNHDLTDTRNGHTHPAADPRQGTDLFFDGGQQPVPQSGTGVSSAPRYEKVVGYSDDELSSEGTWMFIDVELVLREDLLGRGADDDLATMIAAEIINGRPFDPAYEEPLGEEQVQHLREQARTELRRHSESQRRRN